MPGERARGAGLSVREENRRAMLLCIDRFYVELSTRTKGLKDVADMFQCIQVNSLLHSTEDEESDCSKTDGLP